MMLSLVEMLDVDLLNANDLFPPRSRLSFISAFLFADSQNLFGSQTSSGNSTFTRSQAPGYSASVRDTRPGPVVSNTKNSLRNIRGIDFIISSAHSGCCWARTQFF